ncbi:MAG: sensor histidine kinase [bacterium]
MAKRNSYPQNIALISIIFICLIIFLAIVNLYVINTLKTLFVDTYQTQIASFARVCGIYLNSPEKEDFIKPLIEAFNLGNIVITDSTNNKIYDSSLKLPGVIQDNIKIFRSLPEPGKIIQQGNNLVYHNLEPDFYLYLFNSPGYFTTVNLFRWHLIYITLSLILISFLGFFLIRDLFLPMRYVARAAQRLGIEMHRTDFVSVTFNEIFDKLKSKEKELLEFSAYIAHEFRNSLATITGLARLIQKGKKNPEEILKECNIMESLISNLLEYARPVKLIKSEFVLSDLLTEAIKKVEIPTNITMESEYRYSGKIYADYELLLSAMINIIKNSVEAITTNGKIKITTMNEMDIVIISISDTGKGIPEENLKNIFSPFYTNKKGGTGLGLAFVKKVIELHNGIITVDSRINQGTEFNIRLPINS